MLTRLRVAGFKNLLDVDVRFGPFTCIAGQNGAGKSNLFDAIRFLSLLAQHPIMRAAQLVRETSGRSADPRSLFTSFGDFQATEIRLTAEMIVRRQVEDELGNGDEASISTLTYEVAFRLDGDPSGGERLELVFEQLIPTTIGEARKNIGFKISPEFKRTALTGARRGGKGGAPAFITTEPNGPEPKIRVHQEGHGGRVAIAPKSTKTVVGATDTADFPTVLAARQEMASWRTLLLEPSAMRGPSEYPGEQIIDARGANLPAAIYRLQKGERQPGQVYAELESLLAQLIDDVDQLRVRDEPQYRTLTLDVRSRGGTFHPARSLSDGTLRFLVLATLSIDPQVGGIICLEEPENGIHPERIPVIVRLLRNIAVDPAYAIGADNPLRQVMVNTHSPDVMHELDPDELIYMDSADIARPGGRGHVAIISVPAKSWRSKLDGQLITVGAGRLEAYATDGAQFLFQFSGQGAAEGQGSPT
jgi:predicted ATPase